MNHKAYVSISPRADPWLFQDWLNQFNTFQSVPYEAVAFEASDAGKSIYHTNVMMGMLSKHAVISLESIADVKEQQEVINQLTNPNLNKVPKKIIDISLEEVNKFCGNVI